jgi:F-type H+-transporting ATPase subunit delta
LFEEIVVTRRFSARRYARAILEIALEKKQLDEWQSDLEKVALIAQDTTIASFLESPDVRFEDKASLLSERLGDLNPMVLNLVYLLLTKGRLNMLADIVAEYQSLVDKHYGIERAEVTTAIPLDDEDRLTLSQKLGDIIDKKVVIEPEYVDPSLIGGVVVKIGGKLLDGSTRGKLEALKKEMS